MSEVEIRERFRQFWLDCPSGFLSKERFIELAADMLGPDAEAVGETIFKVCHTPWKPAMRLRCCQVFLSDNKMPNSCTNNGRFMIFFLINFKIPNANKNFCEKMPNIK